MGQVKTEKTFYRNFFSIYIVLVLQNVVTISVNLADNVMLGGYSETALSGVAAVNQIQFVYQQLLTALGDGLVIFCSQYWGKRQTQPMRRISAAAMQAGLLIAVLLFADKSVPEQAVGLFTTETAIIREGASYLRIVRFTYFFFAVTTILLATLRSVETVKIAFALSVMAFFVNCCINYVLIYGKFGAPEMGAEGAAERHVRGQDGSCQHLDDRHPLSFVMAFVVKASPAVVVCCLNADQIFKCVPAFLESHYGNWIRKLTREP